MAKKQLDSDIVKAYFSRKVPFYLLAEEELTDSLGFDAIKVEVPLYSVKFSQKMRSIVKEMQQVIENNPAPEECAQEEADVYIGKVYG